MKTLLKCKEYVAFRVSIIGRLLFVTVQAMYWMTRAFAPNIIQKRPRC